MIIIPLTHRLTMADSIHTPTAARLPLRTLLRIRGLHLDQDDEAGGADGDDSSSGDDDNSFVDRMVKKYDETDRKNADREDGIGDDDDEGKKDDDDDDDAEHPEAGTSADEPEEDEAESDEDSADDDDEEHPDDAEDDDSAEDSPDDDDVSDDAPQDKVSAAITAALATKGADLTLDDVPEKYRPIVAKKVKGMDAAFTKVMTEASAFRTERTKLVAEEKFRADNPEMVVLELLIKDGKINDDLFDKVNAQIERMADPTVAEAFKIVVERKRNEAVKAIEDQTVGADRFEARISEVETLTKKHAAKSGVPEWLADQAVGNAVSAALAEKRDVTNEEIAAAVAKVAKQYKEDQRSKGRTDSKKKVQARTEQRRVAPPAGKKPATAASPSPSGAKKRREVNWGSEESRVDRILETARRVKPGAR